MKNLTFELKITIGYLVVGCLWILFSDQVLYAFFKENFLLTEYQIFNSLLLVIATAILLYFILNQHLTGLRASEQKAIENDRLKSTFLQNISHEIRTPMNGIIGFAALLNDPQISEKQKVQFLEIISKSSHQLLKTINDLLDISLIETGSLRRYEDHVHLNKLMEEIYLTNKPQIKEDISFSLQKGLPDDESAIIGDEPKIRQVLNNLLNNANKFTESGHIQYGYSIVANELEFFVKDTGIGISSNFLKKIFEHYLKAELETSKLYEGVGLGLAICKGYIDLLGGRIWVKSEINKGSVFYFTLPYRPDKESVKKETHERADKAKPHKLTLLVVEDDQSNYIYIKQILSGTGSTVYHALNGKEAVEICRKDSGINLVLMDIKMPIMNGYEATKMIREIHPNIPIIAQSAFALKEEREMALNAGCNDYISKPFKKEQIISIIENLN